MAQNSFDIVSKIDPQEVTNAVHQATKEIHTRFDLKSTNSTVEFDSKDHKIVLRSPDEFTLRAVRDVLDQKLARRGVPLKGLTYGTVQPAAGAAVVQEIALQQGIPMEKAREVVQRIKQLKLKVQAAIQGDQVRVSGKNRDDLQKVIGALKEQDFGIDMQFTNYRGN